jgi:diaminopimelate decarboxylase
LLRLEELVTRLREAGVSSLESLDLGGGFFVPYEAETPIDLEAYRTLVEPVVLRLGLTLIVEPGRFLVAESGSLLTRVLYRKSGGRREHQILVTDAGMNDLLRPSLYSAFHRIDTVLPHDDEDMSSHDIVGPICETGDFIALARPMPAVSVGELLCVRTVGAYGYSMSSNYNARPRAAEVLVDDGRFAGITIRETYEDLVRRESVSPQWRNAGSNTP